MFVGYPKGTRGGLFYSPKDKKVFVSTNATFLENDYMTNFKPRSKVILEEMLHGLIPPRPTTVVDHGIEETTVPDQVTMVPKRSGTKIRLPSRYRQNIEANIVTDTNEDDPLTFTKTVLISICKIS